MDIMLKKTNADQNMKEKIIEESIKLFLQKSFRGTTIEDITDAVKVTKGAFYWHFKSKNELLETIIDEFDKGFVDSLIKTVEGYEGGFLEKFKLSHRYAAEFAYAHRELCIGFVTLSAEFVGNGIAIDLKIKSVYDKFVNFFRRLLELGKQEGKIKDDLDVDVAAHVIVGINNGALLEWYMYSNTIDSKKLAKTYRNISLSGILKESG